LLASPDKFAPNLFVAGTGVVKAVAGIFWIDGEKIG
jgi:hypothetical protein